MQWHTTSREVDGGTYKLTVASRTSALNTSFLASKKVAHVFAGVFSGDDVGIKTVGPARHSSKRRKDSTQVKLSVTLKHPHQTRQQVLSLSASSKRSVSLLYDSVKLLHKKIKMYWIIVNCWTMDNSEFELSLSTYE
ncbi:hypothetical protein PsorP6_001619 [Peronosclerospora sorghi]|uniref:Uncharacterized protein n=1 Tax=Peronosclerospora sorghi TaxID=230839 RepID=A0ACC0WYW5_9STRA|nr:hypothetical protein PsorP6_001619 [Peronosclerospora sorghi]